jgi:Secretion system C-terminal sorting domain
LVVEVPYVFNDTTTLGFLRENHATQQVWYLPGSSITHPCGKDEFVLFDFAMQPGDTLSQCIRQMIGEQIFPTEQIGVITHCDSQFFAGQARKYFHFNGIQPIGLMIPQLMQIAEGVGFTYYSIFSGSTGPFLSGFCEGNLWECNITSGTSSETEQKSFLLYPNPTTSLLHLPDVQPNDRLTFYNQFGQKVLQMMGDQRIFDISGLSAGVYALTIENAQGGQELRRLVVKL